MFRIITFTDVHLADKSPAARIDNYRDAILDKLQQASDIAKERKVDLAICAGDLFHLKSPSKNSHYLVSRTIEIFKNFPCPVFSIYGNHDICQDNLGTLPKQPFYVLLKSGALQYLEDAYFHNNSIRIFGMDYLANPEYENFNRDKTKEKIQMCVAHVNASSKFDDLFGERVYKYQELSKCTPDIFLFGHYHPDQGIEIHNNKHFINVGSLSRGSLKKDELTRIPNLGFIEIDDNFKIKTEKIPLKVKTASEIFDLEMKKKEDVEQKEIENFINEMKSKIFLEESDDITKTIKSLSFEKKIRDKAMEYFERAVPDV
jgi:DNA repair exonuclease SbcCD nuclease subunit